MSKDRKSTKEARKQPALTLMEKRAAKKDKKQENVFLFSDKASPGGPGAKRG